MCTMTWFVNDDGYELFFNRDERKSRRRADLPTVQTDNGVRYLSPTDADAGGTWIAANQYGVTVCLLNHYQFEQIESYKQWISRGEMVRRFATIQSLAQASNLFDSLELKDYRAFRMFVIDRSGRNLLCVWDGHSARIEHNVHSPKSSSSADAKHVKSVRKDLYINLNLVESTNVDDYINFHASHLPSRSKKSVCMHRDDASTISFSHVSVSSQGIEFSYADGSPCEVNLGRALAIKFIDPGDILQSNRNERRTVSSIASFK